MNRAAVLAMLLLPGPLFAHGLGVQARTAAGAMIVEGYFDDDTPAAGAKLTIANARGEEVLAGVLDAAGSWRAALPAAGQYRITIDAGDGHLAHTTIRIEDRTSATVSAGPSREEFTRVPWLRIALGLALIAALFAAIRLLRPKRVIPPTGDAP